MTVRSTIDDSHGYCRVLLRDPNEQKFNPVLVEGYLHSSEFDGTKEHLEYLYHLGEYSKVFNYGEGMISKVQGTSRKEILELIIRSGVHLMKSQEVLEHLAMMTEEFKTEDPGREYLRVWVYEELGMPLECITAAKDYLKLRPGDLVMIEIIIKSFEALKMNAEEWIHKRNSIKKAFSRK